MAQGAEKSRRRALWAELALLCPGALIALFSGVYRFSGLVLCALGVWFCLLGLSRRRWVRSILLAALFVVLLAGTVTGAAIFQAGRGSADTECGYVIVLGAGVDGTAPSLSLQERISAADAYLTAHPDAVCIVSGAQGDGEAISEAECMYRELVKLGISPERIRKEEQAANTRENLAYSAALIASAGGTDRPVGIVSSEYHLYRAERFAEALGLTAVGIPARTGIFPLRVNYFLREIAAVWYYTIFGG